jgi:hypothetical protein
MNSETIGESKVTYVWEKGVLSLLASSIYCTFKFDALFILVVRIDYYHCCVHIGAAEVGRTSRKRASYCIVLIQSIVVYILELQR